MGIKGKQVTARRGSQKQAFTWGKLEGSFSQGHGNTPSFPPWNDRSSSSNQSLGNKNEKMKVYRLENEFEVEGLRARRGKVLFFIQQSLSTNLWIYVKFLWRKSEELNWKVVTFQESKDPTKHLSCPTTFLCMSFPRILKHPCSPSHTHTHKKKRNRIDIQRKRKRETK